MNLVTLPSVNVYIVPEPIDKDDVTEVVIYWGAPVVAGLTLYLKGAIVRPAIDNGYYYEVVAAGITALDEPVWGRGKVIHGTCVLKAVDYDLFMSPSDTLAASTWTSSSPDSVILASPLELDHLTSIRLSFSNPSNPTLSNLTLTNRITKTSNLTLTRSLRFTLV